MTEWRIGELERGVVVWRKYLYYKSLGKCMEKIQDMFVAFVDVEKRYERVTRDEF